MSDQSNDHKSDAKIQLLKNLPLHTSPTLKHRIISNLESSKEDKSRFNQWFHTLFSNPKLSATYAFLFLIMCGLHFYHPQNLLSNDTFQLNQNVLIRVDIRSIQQSPISYAEVALENEGIAFTSSLNEDITKERKLILSWESLLHKQYLPVIVKGLKEGNHIVKIHFYDQNKNLIMSKSVNVTFKHQNQRNQTI